MSKINSEDNELDEATGLLGCLLSKNFMICMCCGTGPASS